MDSWVASKENVEFIRQALHLCIKRQSLGRFNRRRQERRALCTDQSVGIGRSTGGVRLVEKLPADSAFRP